MHCYAIFSLTNISYIFLSSGIGNFQGLVQFKESLNRCIPWEWDEEGMTFQADDSSSVLFFISTSAWLEDFSSMAMSMCARFLPGC